MGLDIPAAENGIETARLLETAGIDLLDITFGMEPPQGPVPEDFPLSPIAYSGYRIHRAVNIPVIGVGGLNTGEKVRTLIEGDYADLAGAAKASLADYDFARKVIAGEAVKQCVACKECFWFTDHTMCPARRL
jgi:2,4-dienoyl-CoA reductase-like NADH-dependent reductase (Old Yellow Enzyme family)